MDDPIAEWGQLLAYLPALRRYLHGSTSTVIFLPTPQLTTNRNVHAPKKYLGEIATSTGVAVGQVRRDAADHVRSWEVDVMGLSGRYTDLLRIAT